MFVFLLSVSAYPERYGSWFEYIQDHGNLEGFEGLPAFYAANKYLGDFGVIILMIALAGLVLSSLVGNITSLIKLFCAVGRDRIIPCRFSKINKNGIPTNIYSKDFLGNDT